MVKTKAPLFSEALSTRRIMNIQLLSVSRYSNISKLKPLRYSEYLPLPLNTVCQEKLHGRAMLFLYKN